MGERDEGMGQIYQEYLLGPRIYKCSSCKAHAADHADIFSKSFNGRHGRAYLFNNVLMLLHFPPCFSLSLAWEESVQCFLGYAGACGCFLHRKN